jgi:hypothetical protein
MFSLLNQRERQMQKYKGMRWVLFLGMTLAMLTGCGLTRTSGGDGSEVPQLSNFADDIKEITIPAELEWDRKSSMVIKTESFRGGIFTYKGRVEPMSLKDYMVASMQDNKWRLVGETASKEIMLAFVKPNKTCMMVIGEGMLGRTELKLYVTIDKTGGAGVPRDSFPQ